MNLEMTAILMAVGSTFIGAFGSLMLKFGSENFTRDLKKFITNYTLFIGIFLYGIASVIFVIALQWADLSVLYPIASLTYIWVSLISMKFLNEKMNKFKWIGNLLIVLGVMLIGLGR
ncbi:EamA family transporter [Candidatus Woesearchaeota archaeon]|nr:EamA family transporter [Candidatus Woesearchaeota archaeon]